MPPVASKTSEELQDLVGERVIISNLAGKIRAGRRSTWSA